ncbi:class I SAM-dependent methyltransferase [Accumulibacter sp.]|uniref:class I SAM-dependent methyltransferase n=1 Tax=Accumulibacter sp. TaxID=2053492 RepID=UPI002C5A1A67|nr:class I SAM-dependent methyltransferase [Accumulibacter sp.]HMW64186.1 class I SAM-dependent methyltransferase [Accumulibacter sp.]HNG86823.1 class I SAM-dependent methyltransferase [Accumulibacter sp.]HNL95580.1 class I SAM-dependent methyltransferase [Accumulibacter sp.]
MDVQLTPPMKIADPAAPKPPVNEVKLMLAMLPVAGARILELGCGRAEKTRTLAETGGAQHILALEVDQVQHAKNLQIDDLPSVRFAQGGAEAIPAEDESFDIVIMLKSLHHVRPDALDAALGEIARVLRPGGLAWISEPVYAGELNEIMRLFHDEKLVRQAAFAAVCRAVESGRLRLREELFFSTRSHFADFAQFDARMIRVTHSQHALSPELYREVEERFSAHLTPNGVTLLSPQRVDLLEKPR